MVIIEARVLGKKRPFAPEWSVPIPGEQQDPGSNGLTLRQLIGRIVRSEVAAFTTRQEARKFVRLLTEAEIASRAKEGKVDAGESHLQQHVDADQAIGIAMQAFDDGVYLVLLDAVEQKDLDAQVYVGPESRVVFLRLAFLAGA